MEPAEEVTPCGWCGGRFGGHVCDSGRPTARRARCRRVEAATLLYIVLLSYVIPVFLSGVGLGGVAKFFLPYGLGSWQAAGVMAVHVALVAGVVAWRWRRALAV